MNAKNKITPSEIKANSIRYMAQDIIDNISNLLEKQLEDFEKEVFKILNENDEKWTLCGKKSKKVVDKKVKK